MTRAVLLALVAASQLGCALGLHGGHTTQRVYLETDPPGALAVSGGARCETPCDLELPRKRDAAVELSKEGYEPVVAVYRSRLGGAVAGNLVFSVPGVLVGIPVDVLSGAAYELVPARAGLRLRPLPAGAGLAPAVHLETTSLPASPPPPPVVQLAPRPARRFALALNYGFGSSRLADDVGVLHLGLVATTRLSGGVLAGAAADGMVEMTLFGGGGATGRHLSAVVGWEGTPSSSSRLTLLLQAGAHRIDHWNGSATLPSVGARAEWSAVLCDRVTLGGYAAYWWDVGTRTLGDDPYAVVAGGSTVALGFAVGALAL